MANSELKNTLLNTISTIQGNPGKAKVQFKSDTQLIEGVKCQARVRQFSFNIDEPEVLGGTDSAPNPVELVLAALGTCQEILYSAYASVYNIQLDSVKVKVKVDLNLNGLFGLDENVAAGFQNISYETEIKSSSDINDVQKLIENVEKHCPVLDTLTRKINVTGTVKIVASEIIEEAEVIKN